MNTRRAWILYTVLRLLFFAVPFAVLYFIGWPWWLALVVATLASVSLSIIFLSKPRDAASAGIYEWRTRERTEDDIVEDDAIESSVSSVSSMPSKTSTPPEAPMASEAHKAPQTDLAQDEAQDELNSAEPERKSGSERRSGFERKSGSERTPDET